MNLNEEILNEKLIHKGNFMDFVNIDVKLPNGKNANRDVIKHPGACAVIAFLDSENIILVEQFRLPLNKTLLEIPAGKLNKKEDPMDCAKRELQEETGYVAKEIEYLGSIATAPGFCDEIIHLYKAWNLSLGEKNEDEDEFTSVKVLNINDLKEMIKKGEIIDGKTISVLSYL
ncbi:MULTISPECIES: NUDIX domain-containing protein [Clostridium]|jgi:ADP-ribose pyrophosphatase|uniref:NUDIX hydrolase n=1 Tax=Clostridium tertium TaxID=1559 RepID=A0A9X3XKL9_9CLOT|nr:MULTISPECIES: NUDIX hydrolase [Clostridium]MBS5308326.1 NUDIX hydrolase [Clostridium sp.]MBS5885444.1 NUDIX hydrolase [Clostridium sp.]MBU6135230.1 NUDIX hydrolase [Clostridium tertium]MDB1933223.1 NUDIX hydrolase [Clostridium tertium]MDB1938089.1 NUDIX hydrolase [Clostridium tertium]